jgi:uncharacterized protein (DUF2062 family)|tara:strand:+ start:18046 stop:18585 length:540 start_codon:yes stop_codon:yes gene_type:complete
MVKGIIRNSLSKFHEQFHKAARSKTSSHEIALGMAVGIFIGFLPFLGFQFLIGLVAIFLFRINKITTLLGVFVTNPITIPPIFAFNYIVGKFIVGAPLTSSGNLLSINTLLENFKPLMIGSVVVGFVVAIIAYCIAFAVVKRIKRLHLKEKMKKSKIAKKVKSLKITKEVRKGLKKLKE